MSNELPLRVHLVPITGESIETTQWACHKCHWVWKNFDMASACCSSKAKATTFDHQGQTVTEIRNVATGKPTYYGSPRDGDLYLSPEEINEIVNFGRKLNWNL